MPEIKRLGFALLLLIILGLGGWLAPIGVAPKVDYIYMPTRYTPFFEGEIRAIDYAEDGIILSFPFPEAFSTTQALLQQDGRLFRSTEFIRFVAQNSSHTWESKALLNLTAAGFVAVDGSGDYPDFTFQGGPIRFGYTRTNSRSATLPPIPAAPRTVAITSVATTARRKVAPHRLPSRRAASHPTVPPL